MKVYVEPQEVAQMEKVASNLRDKVHAMKLDDSVNALRLLQKHLGHDTFNTTAKYRKVAGDEHRKWYDHLWLETS